MWESEGGRGGDASAARAGERPCSGLGAGREWARAVGCAGGGEEVGGWTGGVACDARARVTSP